MYLILSIIIQFDNLKLIKKFHCRFVVVLSVFEKEWRHWLTQVLIPACFSLLSQLFYYRVSLWWQFLLTVVLVVDSVHKCVLFQPLSQRLRSEFTAEFQIIERFVMNFSWSEIRISAAEVVFSVFTDVCVTLTFVVCLFNLNEQRLVCKAC